MKQTCLAGLILLTFAVGSGCSFKNKALNPNALPLEKWVGNETRSTMAEPQPDAALLRPADNDGIFVGIAISGGGSRSANFSAACFFQLQKLGLLQEVDYISSVSGGSITAAYYCLQYDEWNPAEVQKRFTHSFATDMIWTIFAPWNIPFLIFSDWDRSDILADRFEKVLFSRNGKRLTFADLRPDRPRLLINATDLQSGRGFIFTNESFNEINSDLSHYPIANAVAASAAVPVLLHQVTLRDFSTIYKQYLHLVDGGVVDNLGVHTLLETYDTHQRRAQERGEPAPYPRGAVIIVLDAQTAHDTALSEQSDFSFFRSIAAGASVSSNVLIQRAGTATLADMIVRYAPDDMGAQEIRDNMKLLTDQGHIELNDRHDRPVNVIHLSLKRLEDIDVAPFSGFSSSVNNIQTYFNIAPTEAYYLYMAADLLINKQFHEELQAVQTLIHDGPTTQKVE